MTAIKAIHASARALGLDEETRRDIYRKATGKSSLTEMSQGEQLKVLDALRASGAQPQPKGRKVLTGPYAKKLQALWIAGWNLGIVRNRDDKAMLAFIARQTGISNTAFLRDSAEARKAVEALKSWLGRDGGVRWGSSNGHDFLQHDPGKVAWAQWVKLTGAELPDTTGFYRAVQELVPEGRYPGRPLGALKPADWRTVMNALGARIRQAQTKHRKAG
ncbi:regulatory protein GemA [Pelagibacterium halotolerans]|uniref:Mu-like prophage protein gp16 n=1 Tax=Pelagibacterium halotolerans (strain DSM 22347 / JCM 15775 / CGMCC 1.7692 / B2) TaxID=1082931 RepID=G4RDE8_PELHB|nr:regulatory protein GemA [Pelagibacterium halotolerans]AEQ50774.1 hypothetical protein KKY_735 [Pelagibacterium halotolerans B2]QJR19309.1 regulatory protein GemA [Pelagibacterium halotolerans]SDZ95500.1 Protein of unknown function [Pelagibacterium halotolerans]